MSAKALLLSLLAATAASAASPKIGCVAEVANPADAGRHWVLVFLKFIDGARPDEAYRVYAKTGQQASPAPYGLLTTIQKTTDPVTLGHLLQQAQAAGIDLVALEARLTEMTAGALPGGTLAEKVSLLIQGKSETGVIEFQRETLASTHPAIASALGRAALVRVASNTPTTFEVRAYNPKTLTEGAVIGRATVGTGPTYLDAPSGLSQKVDASPAGDLRVQLQWCYPQPLREKFLHWSGTKVFRANRQVWIDAFGVVPPAVISRAALLAAVASGHIVRVNALPVLPEEIPNCPLAPAFDTPMFTDDNDSADTGFSVEEGGQPFVAGDRYMYWVAECDVLGRAGNPSQGVMVTICDRIAPRPPVGLKAINVRTFESGSAEDFIRLEWPAAPASDVRRWYLYCSSNYDQVLQDYLVDPTPLTPSRLVTVPNDGSHETADGMIRFDHRAPATVPVPGPSETVYYRLRAEDDTPCKDGAGLGNISGPTGPVPASIHDLIGPNGMGGRLDMDCCDIVIGYESANGVGAEPFTARLQAARPSDQWQWVEFRSQSPNRFVGRYYFAPGKSSLTVAFQPAEFAAPTFGARFGHAGGRISEWSDATAADPLPFGRHTFTPRWDCTGTMDAGDCPGFYPPLHPETGELNELCVTFNAHADIASWIVFRQLGPNGRKTKVASGNVVTPGPITVCDGTFPPHGGELCYYIQGFDAGGNPGPMEPVGCVKVAPRDGLPVPTITGTAPDATETGTQHLEWFCPPGAERFDLAFSPPPSNAESTFFVFEAGGAIREFGIFETARVPTDFGANAPAFADTMKLIEGVAYRFMVRSAAGIGDERDTGTWSKPVILQWLEHTNPVAEVPWPLRDTPGLSGAVRAEWDSDESIIRVAIGQLPFTSADVPLPVDSIDPYLYHSLSVVAYLHQTSPGGRGTMLQTTHRLDRILTAPAQGGSGLQIIDESIKVASSPATVGDIFPRLWLRIDQPVLTGRRYAVTLVFHDAGGEVREVLRSNDVQVPLLLETGN